MILASVELGWLATYQSRSLWCMPSTEISSTCLLTGAGACAAALAEPCNADSAYAATTALAATHAKVFRLVTGTPVRADLFAVPEFFSSQGEIRVPMRRTTREPIEATCRLLATSREFGATSTNELQAAATLTLRSYP